MKDSKCNRMVQKNRLKKWKQFFMFNIEDFYLSIQEELVNKEVRFAE